MKSIFRKLFFRNLHLLILELLFAYVVVQLLVTGSQKISTAIDRVLQGDTQNIFSQEFLAELVLIVLAGTIFTFIKNVCAQQLAIRVQTKFRDLAADQLMEVEYQFISDHHSASVYNKLLGDIGVVSEYYSGILPQMITIIVTVGVILYSLLTLDSILILFFLISFPVILLISWYANSRLARMARGRWQLLDELNEIGYDSLSGITVGRSFQLDEIMNQRIETMTEKILRFDIKRNYLSAISWGLSFLVKWGPHILLSSLALMRVVNKTMTVGELTFFILMLDRIVQPLSELPALLNAAKEAEVSKKRLEQLMNEPKEAFGSRQTGMQNECAVSFSQVSFGYTEGNELLKDLSLQVMAGSKVAIVGESGEGKSTIFRLLCGFYSPGKGELALFGTSLNQWDITAARKMISIVSQNVFLFPDTIAWNVACGNKDVTIIDVIKACKLANIHDFIMNQPLGYETPVMERGDSFSGGEKQRLSIARAFLKNAPILLLDEPTSAIDMGTEKLIKTAIERISKGKTVLTIAHRLSTIQDADRIYVLSKGKIAESGTHQELLGRQGAYRRLIRMQEGGEGADGN